jgi:hypothetical protein
VSPADRLWIGSGILGLIICAGIALCAFWPAFGPALVETAAELLVSLGAQLGAAALVGLMLWAGGER